MNDHRSLAGRADDTRSSARPRAFGLRLFLGLCALAIIAGFLALGTWQVVRLQWKLDLIERVNQRVRAEPVQAPGSASWSSVTAATDEYRHVLLRGTFLYDQSARVQAVTVLGSGFWVITPLRSQDGTVTLVNRGFVTSDAAAPPTPQNAAVVVTGLLRISEPNGGFLRQNDPLGDRWYSRDVQAIAAARGLTPIAPYFVDADADSAKPVRSKEQRAAAGEPVGGLTVIAFHNNHLVYALTWYALALMLAGACFWVMRDERRQRRPVAERTHQEPEHGKNS